MVDKKIGLIMTGTNPVLPTVIKEKIIKMNNKLIMVCLFILILLLSSGETFAWEYRTDLGIRIRASQTVINQYNRHWYKPDEETYPFRKTGEDIWLHNRGFIWDNIDWSIIDKIWFGVGNQYNHHANPQKLIIRIRPIAYRCFGEHDQSYDFVYGKYGCIDGIYASNNLIVIFLGDNSGQGEYSFCGTAMEHEFIHYFRFWSGDPNWWSERNIQETVCIDLWESN